MWDKSDDASQERIQVDEIQKRQLMASDCAHIPSIPPKPGHIARFWGQT